MADVATISLHDAGQRLAELHGSREQIACGKLLSLLKTGQVKAGFQFPAGQTVLWITIPAYYWATVSSDKFKIIRYSKSSSKSGALTVRLGQFPEEVLAQVNEASRQKEASSNMWKLVLAASSQRYEAVILEADWIAYEEQNRPSVSPPKKESKVGRPEKNWKDICVIIGAYIIKHHQVSPEDKIKVELASEKIHKIAEDGRILDLPTAPTIREVLSRILSTAKVISIN